MNGDQAFEREIYVKNRGARIYVKTYGDDANEPLVFIHGNGESGAVFKSQIDYFKDSYYVVVPDSRGHGKSTMGDAPLTIPQIARDVAAVLSALNIEKANLVGFSDGGNAAIAFSLLFPQNTRSIVLAGANLFPSGVKFFAQAPVDLSYRLLCLASIFDKKAALKRDIVSLMVKKENFSIKNEELLKIACPALVMAGEKDLIKASHTRLICGLIKNSRLHIIPGAGHFTPVKNAGEFCRAVGEFLSAIQ